MCARCFGPSTRSAFPYEREDWGRGYRSTDEAEFKRVSNFGVVPVIDDDGFILRESNTIVRYLCSKHGRDDLYPGDLRQRAQVEAWMDWGSTDLYQGARTVFLGLSVKLPAFQDERIVNPAIADWIRQMQRLDQHLAIEWPLPHWRALHHRRHSGRDHGQPLVFH